MFILSMAVHTLLCQNSILEFYRDLLMTHIVEVSGNVKPSIKNVLLCKSYLGFK